MHFYVEFPIHFNKFCWEKYDVQNFQVMFKDLSLKCCSFLLKRGGGATSFSISTNIAVYFSLCCLEINMQLMDALFDLGLLFRPIDKHAFFFLLISQPKHILWVLKRTVSMRRVFEHPKHILKLVGKKILTILFWFILTNAVFSFLTGDKTAR